MQFVLLARPRPMATIEDEEEIVPTSPTSGNPAESGNTDWARNNAHPGTDWCVPEPQEFHDVLNRAECLMVSRNLTCLRAQKWANMWGRVGLIGLSAKHPEDIRAYRDVIEELEMNRKRYTLFPRDAVDKRGSVSILLRETFRAMDPLCLPQILFARNRGLGGTLKVTHIKSYNEEEKTRSGITKKHWRLILMKGCASFMKSLEAFSEDHKFHIGSGHIYISGGARKPRETPAQKRRPRTDARRGGSENNNNNNANTAYDRDFPRQSRGFGGNREGRGGSSSGGFGRGHDEQGAGPARRAAASSWRS